MSAFPEELLSAYLDDELSDDERARVEKYLEESADGRRVLMELSEVREAIQGLPQLSMAPGFAEAVMQQVGATEQRVESTTVRGTVRPSRWVASLAAIAALLLLGVFAIDILPPSPIPDRNVALVPHDSRADDVEVRTEKQAPLTGEKALYEEEEQASKASDLFPKTRAARENRDLGPTGAGRAGTAAPTAPADLVIDPAANPPSVAPSISSPISPMHRGGVSSSATASPSAPLATLDASFTQAREITTPGVLNELVYRADATGYDLLSNSVGQWKAEADDRSTGYGDPRNSREAQIESMEIDDEKISFVAVGTPQELTRLLRQHRLSETGLPTNLRGRTTSNTTASNLTPDPRQRTAVRSAVAPKTFAVPPEASPNLAEAEAASADFTDEPLPSDPSRIGRDAEVLSEAAVAKERTALEPPPTAERIRIRVSIHRTP